MSDPHEEISLDQGSYRHLSKARRKIRHVEGFEAPVRDELLHDLGKVADEIVRLRSYISSFEDNAKWLLQSADWVNEYSRDSVMDYEVPPKSLFEKIFGGILVNRRHLERSIRILQRIEESRREGRISR
jgi:hypothetical protein